MVLVEYLAGVLYVEVIGGALAPGKACEELQIVELYVIVWGLGRYAVELRNLFVEYLLHLGAPFLILAFILELGGVLVGYVYAELLLNILQLVLQEVFLLLLVQLLVRAVLDFLLYSQKLQFCVHHCEQFVSFFFYTVGLQQCHLLLYAKAYV